MLFPIEELSPQLLPIINIALAIRVYNFLIQEKNIFFGTDTSYIIAKYYWLD
jgi:hypothetical protein